MTAAVLRPARPDDLPAIEALLAHLAGPFAPGWLSRDHIVTADLPALRALLDSAPPQDRARAMIAARGGATVGLSFMTCADARPRVAHLEVLSVSPQARGAGVARLLMQDFERWARSIQASRATLNVFAGNERARAVYEAAGFGVEVIRYAKPLR